MHTEAVFPNKFGSIKISRKLSPPRRKSPRDGSLPLGELAALQRLAKRPPIEASRLGVH
jgi:hypothetical protein